MEKNNSQLEKKAIRLSSSENILYHADGDGEEETLLSLLKDASEKGLSDFQEIVVCYEDIGNYDPGQGDEPFVVEKYEMILLKDLKQTYEKWFGKKYSRFGELRRQVEERNNANYLQDCRSGAQNALLALIGDFEAGRIF